MKHWSSCLKSLKVLRPFHADREYMWFKLYKRFDTAAAAAAGGWCKPLHPFCVTTTTLVKPFFSTIGAPTHICIVCNCPLHCPTHVGATAQCTPKALFVHTPYNCAYMHNFLAPGQPRPGPPTYLPRLMHYLEPLWHADLNAGFAWILPPSPLPPCSAYKANTNVKLALMVFKHEFMRIWKT